MTKPLPRIRTRTREATVAPVVPVEADQQEVVPVAPRTRVRAQAVAPVATRQAAPATTSVITTRTFSDGRAPEVESNVQQFPVDIPAVHGTVNVGGKITIQPEPDVWISMNVGIWMPCKPTEAALQETYLAASEWCERRLMREMAIAKGEMAS